MKTIKVNRYRIAKRALAEAAAVLRGGGVVVFPTETAYGLAADPASPAALERVYRIKGRPADKQLPLVAADLQQIKYYFKLNKVIFQLVSRYWPGPLTVVLPVQSGRLGQVWNEAAVRVPAAAWARALPAALGRPLTSTSANCSGQPACYSATSAGRTFLKNRPLDRPDLILDAGRLPRRPPSTVVRPVAGPAGRIGWTVLRPGPIKIE